MAMDPSTLARSLLEGVPLVTQRDESNPPPQGGFSTIPERLARTASARSSQVGLNPNAQRSSDCTGAAARVLLLDGVDC